MTQQFYSALVVDDGNFSTHEQIASAMQAMIQAVGRQASSPEYDLDLTKATVTSSYYIGDEYMGPHDRMTLVIPSKVGV